MRRLRVWLVPHLDPHHEQSHSAASNTVGGSHSPAPSDGRSYSVGGGRVADVFPCLHAAEHVFRKAAGLP
jgi:hypothetical protein